MMSSADCGHGPGADRLAAVCTARIFITGSSDGLGQEAARRLAGLGHDVVVHGRNRDRAQEALGAVPAARMALEGDLASIDRTRELAGQANAAGPFQAIIHNAGVYRPGALRLETVDGLDEVFAVNTLAPYLLTALIGSPQRLVYLTSGMHQSGDPDLGDLQWRQRRWNGSQGYANSKLFDLVLAFAVARLWPHVSRNRPDENGWRVRTGRPGAPAGHFRSRLLADGQ
jgi:NAD(P)-dependent dehydrogenase (short-subunit alcohol dehydrogenase family)